jgi:chemotaxis protein histidine kinase CheA
VIQEFLVESYENLSRLDQELVELEKHPTDAALLASIFRTIHTIKGTCGFLAFSTLERMSHQAAKAVTNMMMVASSMTPAQVHPSQRSRTPLRCSPMTSSRLVSSTTRMSRGGASVPLSTADQKSILTAFKPA